ncbi:MAG: GumC family protein [Methylocella sp.]
MEETAIFDVLRRHARMIITLSLVATLVGYGGSFLLPNQYTASALVLVRPQDVIKSESQSANSKEFLDFPIGQSTVVETPSKTYIEIIKSPALIRELVHKLALDAPGETWSDRLARILPAYMKPAIDYVKPTIDNLIQLLKSSITFMIYGSVIQDNQLSNAIKSVQNNMLLEARADTYIFSIKYTANEPQQAADIANTTAKLFIDFMEDARQSESKYGRDRLRTQLDQTRQRLDSARQRVEAFKRAHSIFLYQTEYESKLKVISDLQFELAKVEESLAGLRAVASKTALSNVSLTEKRDSVLRTLRERQAELAPLPGIERELKQLELVEKSALSEYEIVEKALKEAEIKNSYAAREVQLVSEAVPPHLPSRPVRAIIVLVSLLSGMVVSVGLAFLLEYMNRRIRGIRDVEDFVGVKVLATIPHVSRSL